MDAPTTRVLVPVIDPAQDSPLLPVRWWLATNSLRINDGASVAFVDEKTYPVNGIATLDLPQSEYFDPAALWVIAPPGPFGIQYAGLSPTTTSVLTLESLKNSHGWGVVQMQSPLTIVVGPPGITWMGQWNGGVTYVPNQGVSTPDGSSWRAVDTNTNSYPTDTNAHWAFVVLAPDLPRAGTVTTTFNADGSITDVSTVTGITITTAFQANGSITETYGSPLNRTVTTTFNTDGSLTEVTV